MPQKALNTVTFAVNSLDRLETDDALESLARQANITPSKGITFIGFTFHATTPEINAKAMGITYATTRNSLPTALHKMIDIEHQAEDLPTGSKTTDVVGHIVALGMEKESIPDTDWLIKDIIPKYPVVTKGIIALYDRKKYVSSLIDAVKDGESWYFSLEADLTLQEHADIWVVGNSIDSNKIISWQEADDELKIAAMSIGSDAYYKGNPVAYLMGGRDGKIDFIGGALTQSPAGYEQRQPGNSVKFLCSYNALELKHFAVYSSLEDVPENLKTMDGVALTLSQINGIVRQAEAIEKDGGDVNGWAVAKAHFKDTHTVKDGAWVAKASKGESALSIDAWVDKFKDKDLDTIKSMFMPILLESINDIDNFGKVIMCMRKENKMPKTFTDEEYEAEVKRIKDEALANAIRDGVVVKKEEVDKTVASMFTKEQMDTEVAKQVEEKVRIKERIKQIDGLNTDEDTKSDFKAIASAKFPLTEEGDKLFGDAVKRWATTLAKGTASIDTSGGGDNFTPPGGTGGASTIVTVERI